MGNTCSAVSFTDKSFVQAVKQYQKLEDITFTDIDAAWNEVGKDISHSSQENSKSKVVKRTGWKTIRIFVSSTFRDFDAEREMLVKKIFPDLREWCQSRRLHLVECDLRWGVPKDSTTETTLRTCLGEIDRCYAENIMPFFVNMTSERIGWVPLGSQLPNTLKKEYKWVEGMSVTEMEILHGAYRTDNPNALFLIRDQTFLETLPEEHKSHFIDEWPLASYKLEKLKQKIANKFKGRVITYTCEYAGLSKDTGLPRFKGFEDDFAPAVLNFFKERINAQYPLTETERKEDPLEEAQSEHEAFMKLLSERVVGREQHILSMIETHINNGEENVQPVIISGGPGLGKTSIMAALADACVLHKNMKKLPIVKDGWRIFYHFCGAVAGSTDLLNMLVRLLTATEAVGKKDKLPTSLDTAMGLTRGALSNPRTKHSIIIIDAINQLDDIEGVPAPITWLPSKMSQNLRIFISLTPQSSQFSVMGSVGSKWTFLELQPLDRETKEELVKSRLARYNKQLDRGQLELLLNKQASDNPMWLSLATEELRVFGRFRELTNKIRSLPDGLAELESEILGRFEHEGGGVRLVTTLCLLDCSVNGLLESELLELLADTDLLPPSLSNKIGKPTKIYTIDGQEDDDEEEEFIPVSADQTRLTATQWAEIFRVLRPFMRPFGSSGEGRLDFYHRSLSKAVKTRYFYNTISQEDGTFKRGSRREDVFRWFHKKLADYFNLKCSNLERKIEEYPTHAWKCGDRKQLIEFLSNWEVFDAMYDPEFSRRLSQSWDHVYWMKTDNDNRQIERGADSAFIPMEETYVPLIKKEIEKFENLDSKGQTDLIRRIEAVTKVLAENGRYDAAFGISEELLRLTYPDVPKCNLGDQDETPILKREYTKVADNLSSEDRIRFARFIHIQASIRDEEMRQVDYMYRSHIPIILIIIDCLETVIAILKAEASQDKLLGQSLNRCSFYYMSIYHRGGCKHLTISACQPEAITRIEEAIAFYSSFDGQELNLADCYVTRGVVETSPTTEQLRYYQKGLDLILDHSGQVHPLLDRTFLNIAIYHEETREFRTAYDYFRKWYFLLVDLYGKNHPRTLRSVRALNEPRYRGIAESIGDEIPDEGVQGEVIEMGENGVDVAENEEGTEENDSESSSSDFDEDNEDQPAENQETTDQPAENQETADQPADNQETAGQPAENLETAGQPVGNQQQENLNQNDDFFD